MKKLNNITDFNNIIQSEKVIVDFYADWCGPCKMLEPVLDEISNNHKEIEFISVDVDKFRELAKKYGVMSIPCIKMFSSGKEVKSTIGFMNNQELEEFIK